MTAGVRVGRYAPSPTGAMHLGNARTALVAWLHSRVLGARHLLRFEDLDTGRVRPWAYDVLRRDLEWLGLTWDGEYIQSERLEYYSDALRHLPTYPCTCTRRDIQQVIQQSAGAPHGHEPIYPGTCRARPADPERPAAHRWALPDLTVCAHDAYRREDLCQHLPTEVGDFVMRRNDGVYAYHLAVVVDDALLGVTDVVRGADLWPATPRQIALQQTLGFSTPRYLHLPLMTDHAGLRLAKRDGAPPVQVWREAGRAPDRLLADLARSLGWTVPEGVTALDLLPLWRGELVRLGVPVPVETPPA